MFSSSFLFLFILLFSSSNSPLGSSCLRRLGLGISTARAQGVTQNVSTDAITFQPAKEWNGQTTDTPGASVIYLCTQPCTGIILVGSQPDGQQGQFSVCVDCVNAPEGASPNLTAATVFDPLFQFAVGNLSPALHTLQIVTHSTTNFTVDGVQVIFAFPPSSDSSNDSRNSSASNATSSATSTASTSTLTSTSASASSTSTASTSTSTSTSVSASSPSNSTSSASAITSSSFHSASVAIAVSAVLLVIALLIGIALYFYRRRRQRQNGGNSTGGEKWGKGFSKVISWPRPSMEEEPVGPASPMLETFRTSRNLEAGYGPGGLYRAGTTVVKGAGPPAYLSTPDLNNNGATSEGGQQTNLAPNTGTGNVSTRRGSQPSVYSSYTDPWEEVDEDYFNSDDGGNDSDSSGQGHTYLNPKKASSSPTSSKQERLRVNLQIPPNRSMSTRSKKSVRSSRMRDTRASSFQTPAVVKNMLSELNNAIRGNADRFAWKKSMPPVPAIPSAKERSDVPMNSLSPPATTGGGHRSTRSTDVLI